MGRPVVWWAVTREWRRFFPFHVAGIEISPLHKAAYFLRENLISVCLRKPFEWRRDEVRSNNLLDALSNWPPGVGAQRFYYGNLI